ncbi:MAG: glycosyltransferase [Marinicella sp.]
MPTDCDPETAVSLTVLQVVPELKVGGVERGTVEFATYLKQQGHNPIVVSAGGPLVATLESNQITHIQMNVAKKSISSLFSVKKLKNLMIQHQVDVVHARSRIPAWLCHFALQRIKQNKPGFVTTLHGLHSINRYSAIMAGSDAVIAVSNAAKNYLETNYSRYLKSSPIVIYRGIDPQFKYGYQSDTLWQEGFNAKLNNKQPGKTVLLPGRLSPLKGIEHLIPWLQSTEFDGYLLINATPGESNYSRKVDNLFAKHQLSDRLVWLGTERNMPALYAAVDLVVSVNNKPESFGRTVLEALSVGKPVVAFSHGGVVEVMQQLFPEGLVTAGDDAALTRRIDDFLNSPPKVKKHQLFTNQDMFEKTIRVYQKLIHSND